MNSKKRKKKRRLYHNDIEIVIQPKTASTELSKSHIWVESKNFYYPPSKENKKPRSKTPKATQADIKSGATATTTNDDDDDGREPYLILGFDTEFQVPREKFTQAKIKEGDAKYEVLSYQFYAKTSSGEEWDGICCPDDGKRMALADFLVFALGTGVQGGKVAVLPTRIYLVGHFTRADLPAFSDFKSMSQFLTCVRNTFINIDTPYPVNLKFKDESLKKVVTLKVILRDTMLLTPAASKSLKSLGSLVGVEKIMLPEGVIKDMKKLRYENWSKFKEYALNDPRICVVYLENIMARYFEVTGKRKVPTTLTSIGVDLLIKSWKDDLHLDPLDVLGMEEVEDKIWDSKLGIYRTEKKVVLIDEMYWFENFVTECYHGGRNEQFWFGPGYVGAWSDYDLASAYPTAMSLIGKPDWRKFRFSTEVADFTSTTLGFAYVQFSFPETVRFPTLPIRTANGLIFPRTGKGYCAAPEVFLAKSLGAEVMILHGLIIPTDSNVKIFGTFIKECLKRRRGEAKGSINELFWKELTNSTYGKTAQGLREKRVYDMSDRKTRLLPRSRITNAFFASFITSFVRGVLGEIINALPAATCVFSCTTDGFLTDASEAEIVAAQTGTLGQLFGETRQDMTSEKKVLERKHHVKQPLGWRTRGQATLIEGLAKDENDESNIVLAKGGIFLENVHHKTAAQQNREVVELFLCRTPDSKIQVEWKTGVRDMIEFNADLVERTQEKDLNMEFDWKRIPLGVKDVKLLDGRVHLAFSTKPVESKEEFQQLRNFWKSYCDGNGTCLKDYASFKQFAAFADTQLALVDSNVTHIRKINPDLQLLRMSLCRAIGHQKAGFVESPDDFTAQDWADTLTRLGGITTSRAAIENGRRFPFKSHVVPRTDHVLNILRNIKNHIPNLDTDEILVPIAEMRLLAHKGNDDICPLINKCLSA